MDTELTNEQFEQFIKDDEWIKLMAHACEHCDKFGNFEYFVTVSSPVRYIITDDKRKQAIAKFEQRKKEMLAEIKRGELVFVSMGMDDDAVGEIGNHRMRTEFKNKDGQHFFIEISSHGYIDFSIDMDMRKQLRETNSHVHYLLSQPINDMWIRCPNRFRPKELQYNWAQSEYGAMGVPKGAHIDYNWNSILRFINDTYLCNYTSIRRFPIGYFDTNDFTCEC